MDEPNHQKDPYQFVLEADDFSGCILQNKELKANGEEGLRDVQWMAEIYKTAGIKLG
jgi:hypothetical protein